MRITPPIFDAFLKCATKCHLRSLGQTGSGNEYAEWVRGRDECYQREAARRLQEAVPEAERVVGPPATETLKAAKWRLASDLVARTPDSADGHIGETEASGNKTGGLGVPRSEQLLESRLRAVERVPSEGRGKPAQFIPIRFVFRNKLTKDDRLLLAFDASILTQMLGRKVSLGKIIHGDDHATLKVKTSTLAGEVQKRVEKMATLLSSPAPPDLVLNRHCAECEFQARCRQIAVENDDLSLLATMSTKERQKLRSNGISADPQMPFAERHAVFAVLPFDVPVAQLLERPGVESSGQGQFPEPFDERHVNSIGRGIADNEADFRGRGANPPERPPRLCQVEEVAA